MYTNNSPRLLGTKHHKQHTLSGVKVSNHFIALNYLPE